MGSILPVLLAVVFAGLIAQGMQLAQALPGGSSQSGQSQNAAAAAAVQAELYGAACISAALASSGTISSSISVTMPAGFRRRRKRCARQSQTRLRGATSTATRPASRARPPASSLIRRVTPAGSGPSRRGRRRRFPGARHCRYRQRSRLA